MTYNFEKKSQEYNTYSVVYSVSFYKDSYGHIKTKQEIYHYLEKVRAFERMIFESKEDSRVYNAKCMRTSVLFDVKIPENIKEELEYSWILDRMPSLAERMEVLNIHTASKAFIEGGGFLESFLCDDILKNAVFLIDEFYKSHSAPEMLSFAAALNASLARYKTLIPLIENNRISKECLSNLQELAATYGWKAKDKRNENEDEVIKKSLEVVDNLRKRDRLKEASLSLKELDFLVESVGLSIDKARNFSLSLPTEDRQMFLRHLESSILEMNKLLPDQKKNDPPES